ncbi:MAG TPA: hypothetical protein VD969_13770 [Symbiobacteriaceae bacterium]|nr:hypothetical protein [Symbiobacteriaceae bacterium]
MPTSLVGTPFCLTHYSTIAAMPIGNVIPSLTGFKTISTALMAIKGTP